jgi:feruloyl esterase
VTLENASLSANTYDIGIDYPQLAYGTSLGFATVAHNDGYNGTSFAPLYQQPEVVKDFSSRAVWVSALVGKELTANFYAHPQNVTAYHMGCGDGGRQGLRAAQLHPDLFDGIIAGAPAINTDMLTIWYAYALSILGLDESSETFLRDRDWMHVASEVLRQCDGIDGAIDGILEDTRSCKLDTRKLGCGNSHCRHGLTHAQILAMEQIFSPYKHDSIILHPGAAHGNEIGLASVLYGSPAQNAVKDWYRYIFPGNLQWQFKDFKTEDGYDSLKANTGELHAMDPDLRAFRDSGGKILQWHGQADPIISILNSDYYFDLVRNNTSPNATGTAALDDWYRYFRLSGTGYCGGGPGANYIGQSAQTGADEKAGDNVLLAMVAWVEKGAQPDILRGVKWNDDDPTKGVHFFRKHCKHPRVGVYNGTADGKDEDGWKCIEK